ncbi:hypothetical protein GP5015_363 [gamma proteobacterium HTCC5015]|nr:hypothetical protein GP5015_363 [gamma proteobacterium HTCC5015]
MKFIIKIFKKIYFDQFVCRLWPDGWRLFTPLSTASVVVSAFEPWC